MIDQRLAIPIHASVDSDMRLVQADPHILRLHLAAGGEEQGPLAIPQLRALCALSWRLGSGLSRPILSADGERDIRLWVETRKTDAGVDFSILSWKEEIAHTAQGAMLSDFLETGMPDDASGDHDGLERSGPDHDGAPAEAMPQDMPIRFDNRLAATLRQPLLRIIANADTIGERLQGPIRESYAAYARDIANAARHLHDLVDDLADLQAVEKPGFSVAPDIVELGDVIRRAAGLLSMKAADKDIAVILPEEAAPVHVEGEFRRILQILVNLIGNAIRYTPTGSTVWLTYGADGVTGHIIVRDNGPGIDPENRERVFTKFERLGRSGDGGSGLGLHISRELARAMQGDLAIIDTDTDGACFRLTLPLAG